MGILLLPLFSLFESLLVSNPFCLCIRTEKSLTWLFAELPTQGVLEKKSISLFHVAISLLKDTFLDANSLLKFSNIIIYTNHLIEKQSNLCEGEILFWPLFSLFESLLVSNPFCLCERTKKAWLDSSLNFQHKESWKNKGVTLLHVAIVAMSYLISWESSICIFWILREHER